MKEQILNIGNEICGNKKLEHKQQWMTEEILENMEQRKEQNRYGHMEKYDNSVGKGRPIQSSVCRD